MRLPVTVKMRIGVIEGSPREAREQVGRFDEADYEALLAFVAGIRAAGSEVAIVHARKAVLRGLSPRDNREVPPLRYDVVARLANDVDDLPVIVNGGIRDAAGALAALEWCDGVMLGREAYHRPHVLSELERALHPDAHTPTRRELLERMEGYAAREVERGERLSAITRHMLGLCAGAPGAREFRRLLSEGAREASATPALLRQAGALCPS